MFWSALVGFRFLHEAISSALFRWLVHFSDSRDDLAFYFASMDTSRTMVTVGIQKLKWLLLIDCSRRAVNLLLQFVRPLSDCGQDNSYSQS
jgi:hypothetical protein